MELIQSVQRACGLLGVFTTFEPRLTLAELSERVGLPKPTVHRLAATLISAGFMIQHPDGRYGLGSRLMDIGQIARRDVDLLELCLAPMEQLAQLTGETVLLGLADWATFEITIVQRIDSTYELSVVSPVGRRSPIILGALGKALLLDLDTAELERVTSRLDLAPQTDRTIRDRGQLAAEIERCRRLGYATDVGEFAPGVSAVAVPVAIGGERAQGAVAVVGPSSRFDRQLETVGPLVREALRQLERGQTPRLAQRA